jgi:hypothetical protein
MVVNAGVPVGCRRSPGQSLATPQTGKGTGVWETQRSAGDGVNPDTPRPVRQGMNLRKVTERTGRPARPALAAIALLRGGDDLGHAQVLAEAVACSGLCGGVAGRQLGVEPCGADQISSGGQDTETAAQPCPAYSGLIIYQVSSTVGVQTSHRSVTEPRPTRADPAKPGGPC